MNRLLLLPVLVMIMTACTQRLPETNAFFSGADIRALSALPQGGLRYADGTTGEVWDVDTAGRRSDAPVARIDLDNSQPTGILGMTLGPGGETYLAYTSTDQRLTVAQVAPGPIRPIWSGPVVDGTNVGGSLTFTPTGRLLVALGDLGRPELVQESGALNGKLLTLDPSLGIDQRPNVISTGWTNPGGVTYSAGASLWVAALVPDDGAQLVRADVGGPTGRSAGMGEMAPTGLTTFGDNELVACEGDGHLRRFFLTNASATPGRVVAEDCTGDVVELLDRRLAYVAGPTIRVTAQ